MTLSYCRDAYEENASRCFILPPEQGWQGNTIRKEAKRPENRVTRFPVEKSGEAGKGEASAVSQSAEWLFCPMTQKGKSRNVPASPLGEEGHEVAKGWTVVRMIMILLFYVLSP